MTRWSQKMSQPDEKWPGQDTVDRSGHIAIIAQMSLRPANMQGRGDEAFGRFEGLPSEVQGQLASAASTAIWEVTGSYPRDPVAVERYRPDPPTAGLIDIGQYIVTFLESAPSLTQGVALVADPWPSWRCRVASRRTWRTGWARSGCRMTPSNWD